MTTLLLELIQRECLTPEGFEFIDIADIWADIQRIRTWAKCDEYPLTWREFRAEVQELGKAVEIDGERVKAVAGVEVVPVDCLFAK